MTEHSKRNKKITNTQRLSEIKRSLRREIDELKEKVRKAYTLEVQVNVQEYKPTEEEQELIQERAFNIKLLEKLESIYTKKSSSKLDPMRLVFRENQILLHFFYLVRLAQQGFFYMISAAYPDLEPEALVYLCDKLISASIFTERATDEIEKKALKRATTELMYKLVEGQDKPIADGFKTTYKQVTDIIYSLIYQSVGPNPSEETETTDSSPAHIPPLWVIMPQTGMLDTKTFALPGAKPSLPFPSHMLATLSTPPVTFPNAVDDLKKEADALEKKMHKNLAKKKKRAKKEEDPEKNTDELNENETQHNDDNNSKKDNDKEEENDEDDYDEEYERDRFADADTSESESDTDSEEETVKEEETIKKEEPVKEQETIKKEDSMKEEETTKIPEKITVETPSKSQANLEQPIKKQINGNIKEKTTPETDKAVSGWLNFAANDR